MIFQHAFLLIFVCIGAKVTCETSGATKWIIPEPEVQINKDEIPNEPVNRITNGNIAEYGQFPYQAGLRIYVGEVGLWCGGTIISNRHILTAAHCTEPTIQGIDVYVGAWNRLDTTDPNMQIIYVPKNRNNYILFHENWNESTISNDIAIIKLPIRLYFNAYIQPAVLPPLGSTADYADQYVIASGWGLTSDSEKSVTDRLRYIETQVIKRSVCNRYYLGTVKKYQICIRTGSEHTSTCSGDSGGPLVLADGSNTLIGLTSFGIRFGCELGWPGVFTSTAHFAEWIRQQTGIQDL